MVSHRNSSTYEKTRTVATSLPKASLKTIHRRSENKVKPVTMNQERSLYESTMDLMKSKGYRVIRSPLTGLDMIATRPVELGHRYIVNVLPVRLHIGNCVIKVSSKDYGLIQASQGEEKNLNRLRNELVEKTQTLDSVISQPDKKLPDTDRLNTLDRLLEGMEVHSISLLFGKFNYKRLDGKSFDFWVNPVLLTFSKLQNELGESKPWIPIPAKLRDYDVDIVNVAQLASYLDLREREVNVLERGSLNDKDQLRGFPRELRLFRFLTLGAALTLLVTFLIFTSGALQGFPFVQLSLVAATICELFGALRLFKSYRFLRRDNAMAALPSSRRITPEQVVMNEAEFTREELAYLYSKYGGEELSKLRKEVRHQRIGELFEKTRELLSRTSKLEQEGLYSETILSLDRATNCALNATLLSMGVETSGRNVKEWMPILRKVLKDVRFEDMDHLLELKDRVSRGYDASKDEAEKAKQMVQPITCSALDHLRNFLEKNGLQNNLPKSILVASDRLDCC